MVTESWWSTITDNEICVIVNCPECGRETYIREQEFRKAMSMGKLKSMIDGWKKGEGGFFLADGKHKCEWCSGVFEWDVRLT